MTGPIVLAADPSAPSQAANKHYVDTAIAGGGGVAGNCPTGAILDFAAVSAPAGWLKCDGSAYLSTDPLYVNLFNVIGTAFGSAPGGYFKVPDLRNRVTAGAGQTYTLGNIGGAASVVLSVAQLAAHKHTDTTGHIHTVYQDQHRHALVGNTTAVGVVSGTDPTFQLIDAPGPTAGLIDFSGVTTDYQTPTVYCQLGYSVVDNAGSSQAHENMPPYMALTKIIKL
jgi:microcystin-dependent protein